jgi:predicted permease
VRPFKRFFVRLRNFATGWRGDERLREEMEAHLAMQTEENIRAGISPEEARRQAKLKFGSFEASRESYHAEEGLPLVESLLQDAWFALRQMRKSPGFTTVALLTLALGIGLNTALFSIVDAVLVDPLPLPHPDELVTVDAAKPNFPYGSISYSNFRDWQRENQSLAALAIFRHIGFVLTGAGESARLHGDYISSDLFSLLGVRPQLGRLFAPGEDEIGRSPVALISAGLWARKFGSRADVIGRTILLDGQSFTIIGVIPSDFNLTFRTFRAEDVYVPIGQWPTGALKDRGAGLGIHGIARLKPGVTIQQAQADLDALSAHLTAQYPRDDADLRAALLPLRTAIVGDVRPVLLVLLAAVGFVLLIACINVANLLLARSNARAQEFAIRFSLGAGRGRIIRQLLTESIMLAIAGGGLGLALAGWGTHAVLHVIPTGLPRFSEIHLDTAEVVFALVVSLAVGLLFGSLPAIRVASQSPQTTLKDGGRGVRGSRHRAQDWLIVIEMASALVLLAGAGLMIRSLMALSRVSPGFEPHGVLTFSLAIPYSPATSTPDGMRAYLRAVDRRILSVPGVRSASLTWAALPMTGDDDEEYFWLPGEAKPANDMDMHWALRYIVEPGYLDAMGIPLRRGRFITDEDRADSPPVVVIDEDLARRYFGDADPIGRQLNLNSIDAKATIVGVVGHVMQWELDNDSQFSLHSELYVPFAQLSKYSLVSTSGFVSDLVVRADHPATIFPDIQHALRSMNAEQVPYSPKTMDDIIADTLAARRFAMVLLGGFAGLALLLASIGLYGVISYVVGQRAQEMAIRIALGASRRDVLAWVMKRGVRLAAIGAGSGIIAALVVTRLIARTSITNTSMFYGVSPYDPLTMSAVATILLLVSLAACWVPAKRAASVDPMQALRSE